MSANVATETYLHDVTGHDLGNLYRPATLASSTTSGRQ